MAVFLTVADLGHGPTVMPVTAERPCRGVETEVREAVNRFLEEGGMAFMSHVSERFGRTGLSLKHQISDELDIHPGWWIPSLAACRAAR